MFYILLSIKQQLF